MTRTSGMCWLMPRDLGQWPSRRNPDDRRRMGGGLRPLGIQPPAVPDPNGMMDHLHALGFKVMLWTCPFISPDSVEFKQLRGPGAAGGRGGDPHPALVERVFCRSGSFPIRRRAWY